MTQLIRNVKCPSHIPKAGECHFTTLPTYSVLSQGMCGAFIPSYTGIYKIKKSSIRLYGYLRLFQVLFVYFCFLFLAAYLSSPLVSGSKEFQCCKGQIRRRQWQPTRVLLPRKSHGPTSLVGCSHGSLSVGHNGSDLAAAARDR